MATILKIDFKLRELTAKAVNPEDARDADHKLRIDKVKRSIKRQDRINKWLIAWAKKLNESVDPEKDG